MSRSFKKYPIYKKRYGNKISKRFANRQIRISKEVKNKGHYKKFYYVSKYELGGYPVTLEEYLERWNKVYLPDKLYKEWITHYYIK